MCHHSPSQCQTGGSHQDCSYHHGLSCRYGQGEKEQKHNVVGYMLKQPVLIAGTFIIISFIILVVEGPFQKAGLQGDDTFTIKMNLWSLHWL